MISWGWTIVISLAWMFLVNISFSVLVFENKKKKSDLGTVFWCLLAMIVPVIIFVFTNIMCRVYEVNETVYYVIMGILAGIFIGGPILTVMGRSLLLLLLYPPKRMAAYDGKEVGSFRSFNKGRSSFSRYYADKHAKEQAYIAEQILITERKLGFLYRMRRQRGKDRFIRTIMEENRKELPQISGWRYQTVLAGTCRAETAILMAFDDGEESLVYLYWPKKKFTSEELREEDRERLALAGKFRQITMTGRLIYIFMCIERYLISLYPDRDWMPVAARMWNRTKERERWSEGTPGDLYREIVPERIMRFYKHGYGYEELNSMVFDKQLSMTDYTLIRGLYEGISRGDPKEEINQMVGLPEQLIYQANLKMYHFAECDQMTMESILKAEKILESHGIELPDLSLVSRFSFERTADEMLDKEKDRYFGFGVDATELSILLNPGNAGLKERLIGNSNCRRQESESKKNEEKEEESMIREISKKDIPDVVRVIRASFQTVADEFGFTPENAPRFSAFATTENRVKTWMIDQNRPMYGYFEEDRLVGFYNLYLVDDGCELGSLSVLLEYRHRGIGKKLLDDAVDRAKARGLGKMILSIVEENTVLRKWYEENGFTHTGTKKFDFFPFTCGYMERDLCQDPA